MLPSESPRDANPVKLSPAILKLSLTQESSNKSSSQLHEMKYKVATNETAESVQPPELIPLTPMNEKHDG